MKAKLNFLCLVAAAISLSLGAEIAFAGSNSLTSAELDKIDSYLNGYYKNVVVAKTTKNALGEPVSCVDIYHQPALNNPLLVGHKIQTEPSPELQKIIKYVKQDTTSSSCPNGSIETKLPTREQIVAIGSLEKFLSKHLDATKNSLSPSPIIMPPSTSGHYYAIIGSNVNSIAAQTTFNIWQPSVRSDINNFSLSQLWIAGGTAGTSSSQTVEVGWQVYPLLYQDNLPHLFIYFTADGYNSTGCYNLTCGAFVQTSNILTIGGALPSSTFNGTQIEGTLAVYRDPATSNWILFYVDANGNYIQSGYYPGALFGSGQLSQHSTTIQFGGEVALDSNYPLVYPPMGSGSNPFFNHTGYGQVAYQRNIKYLDTSSQIHDVAVGWSYFSPLRCSYDVEWAYGASSYGAQPSWGTSILFGGAGTCS